MLVSTIMIAVVILRKAAYPLALIPVELTFTIVADGFVAGGCGLGALCAKAAALHTIQKKSTGKKALVIELNFDEDR